jgi:hypothetical protein
VSTSISVSMTLMLVSITHYVKQIVNALIATLKTCGKRPPDEKLPFHRAGTHRREYLKDLLEFRKRRDQQRKRSIERIAKEEVAHGTYDDFRLPK